jgi:hypothetical protein
MEEPPPLKTQLSRALYDFNSKLNVRSGALVQVGVASLFDCASLCAARACGGRNTTRSRKKKGAPSLVSVCARTHTQPPRLANTHTHKHKQIWMPESTADGTVVLSSQVRSECCVGIRFPTFERTLLPPPAYAHGARAASILPHTLHIACSRKAWPVALGFVRECALTCLRMHPCTRCCVCAKKNEARAATRIAQLCLVSYVRAPLQSAAAAPPFRADPLTP